MASSAKNFEVTNNTPVLIASGAHTLFGYDVGSNDPSPVKVLVFDKATAPVIGTDQPILEILLPPLGARARATGSAGIAFANGIYLVVSAFHGTQREPVAGHFEYA